MFWTGELIARRAPVRRRPLAERPPRLDRAVAAYLGLAVGDALGATVEFLTPNEIRQQIGADALIYQDLEAMKMAVRALNPAVSTFEASCFDAHYITGDQAQGPVTMQQTSLPLDAQDSEFLDFENRLNLPNGA